MIIVLLVILAVLASVMIIILNRSKGVKTDPNSVTMEVTLVDKVKEEDRYFLLFAPNPKETLRYEVNDEMFHSVYLGCEGLLTVKGNKFIDFVKTK